LGEVGAFAFLARKQVEPAASSGFVLDTSLH